MSVLTIVQDASAAQGLTQPSTIESASDSQTVKMLSLLNRLGRQLDRSFDWQRLIRETSFTTDGSSEYTISSAPISITDLANLLHPFLYDRTDNKVIIGIGDNEYQLRKMYNLGAISRYRFRLFNDKLQFDDPVPTNHNIYFEYKTKNWVIPETGSDKSAFNLDGDTSYLDEELLTLGLIYKFKNEQGLTYDEEFREYQEFLNKLKDQDRSEQLVSLASKYYSSLNIPDTFTGQVP
jgi:hypothetical protein